MVLRTEIVEGLSPSNAHTTTKSLTRMPSPSSVDQVSFVPAEGKAHEIASSNLRRTAPRWKQEAKPKTKMNASDRAKFYRKRIRDHTKELEQSAKAIKLEARNLRVVLDIQKYLPRELSSATRQRMLDQIRDFMESQRYLHSHDFVRHEFLVDSIACRGAVDAPIIQFSLRLRGNYTQTTTERLYRCVPGNTQLLGRLMHRDVEYECTVVFYFGVDGDLEFETVDTDVVGGLFKTAGDIRDVRALVQEGLGNPRPVHRRAISDRVKAEGVEGEAAKSHSIAFLLG